MAISRSPYGLEGTRAAEREVRTCKPDEEGDQQEADQEEERAALEE